MTLTKVVALTFAMLLNYALLSQCVVGDCQNGLGKAAYKNGDTYEGEWQYGKMNGQGLYVFKKGSIYEGHFALNKMDGLGKMTYPDGAYFYGGWKNNKKHGYGYIVLPNKKRRYGLWRGGKRVKNLSKTEFENASAKQNVAQQTPNVPQTNGSDSSQEVEVPNCNATFCNEGQGVYTYRDGSVYKGTFSQGKPSGIGYVTYANGDVYQGEWFEDAPNGEGKYTFIATGRVIAGEWENGKLLRRKMNETKTQQRPTLTNSSAKKGDGVTKMYAVVVGIGSYTAMQALKYTDDDAYQIYAFLKSPEGGALSDDQVKILIDEDATSVNIRATATKQFSKADADDIIVFFFSGHGTNGHLVPHDFDGYNNLLSHQELKNIFEYSNAKHKLIMADACYSGGLIAAKSAQSSTKRLYEAFEKTKKGTAVMMSSSSEEVSLEARGLRSGIFSHFLLEGIRGKADVNYDKVVTITELFNFVNTNVLEYTANRQHPMLSGNFDKNMPVATIR